MKAFNQTFNVEAENELRIYLGDDEEISISVRLNKLYNKKISIMIIKIISTIIDLKIQLDSGKAEIEGRELLIKTEVKYGSRNIKVYYWEKSAIILKSEHLKDSPIISDKNKQTMGEYIIANYFIDKLRYIALTNNYLDPRILVTGSAQSGEREFCHTLINYSLKLGYTPIFVDLDLENEIIVPGSISASVVDYLVPNDFLFDSAITFFTGTNFQAIMKI